MVMVTMMGQNFLNVWMVMVTMMGQNFLNVYQSYIFCTTYLCNINKARLIYYLIFKHTVNKVGNNNDACIHTCMHARMHPCTHTYMHTHIHAHTHAHARTHTFTHACTHTCTHSCTCAPVSYTHLTLPTKHGV